MQSENLIHSLLEQTRHIKSQVELLKTYDLETLTWKENKDSWSVLECLEHLNLYGEFYLPEIERQIKNSRYSPDSEFKSGLLGNYFAKSMLPKEKLNKMKTFKDKNPLNAKLNESVLTKSIDQQIKLLELLNLSKKTSLNKVKIQTSISSLIRLKLGDTFQFFINHIIRHLSQIDKINRIQIIDK